MSWLSKLFKPTTAATTAVHERPTTADSHTKLDRADKQTHDMLESFRRDMEESSQRHIEIVAQLAKVQVLELMRAQRQHAVCAVAARLAQAHVRLAPQWPLSMEDIERLAAEAVRTHGDITQDEALTPQEALREASAHVRSNAQAQRLTSVLGDRPVAPPPERL